MSEHHGSPPKKEQALHIGVKAEILCCRWLLVTVLCAVPCAGGEIQLSYASEHVQCTFQDRKDAKVEYVSMQRNGRKIFGGIVPYGRVWEMGYTRSPTFVTSTDLMMGGKEVPAGHYSLFAIPNPDKWTMIVKKPTGTGNSHAMAEVARIDLNAKRLPSPLERFRISFDQFKGGCVLNLRWEETEASVLLAEKK